MTVTVTMQNYGFIKHFMEKRFLSLDRRGLSLDRRGVSLDRRFEILDKPQFSVKLHFAWLPLLHSD